MTFRNRFRVGTVIVGILAPVAATLLALILHPERELGAISIHLEWIGSHER